MANNEHNKENQPLVPETVEDLIKLPEKQLNMLLKSCGLATRGKRSHKVTTLSNLYQLEVGDDHFINMLQIIRDMKTGWTKDLKQSPLVTLEGVNKYLLKANKCTVKIPVGDYEDFTRQSLTRYKVLRSYNLYASGHVHSMLFAPLCDQTAPYCAVKCKVNPSWDTSGTSYGVILVLEQESGAPVGAYCTCVAGKGESCTHVAATCFALEDFTSRGIQALPEDPASTELLCKWTDPKSAKTQAKALSDVSFKKSRPNEDVKKGFVHHDPLSHTTRSIDYERVKWLVQGLNACAPRLPILTCLDPEMWRPTNNQSRNTIQVSSVLQNSYPFDHPDIVPCSVQDAQHHMPLPPTIAQRATSFSASNAHMPSPSLVTSFMNSLKWTQDEIQLISNATIEQQNSSDWFTFRKGLITGSTIHSANVQGRKLSAGRTVTPSVVEAILGEEPTFHGNAATAYGNTNEENAAAAYEACVGPSHKNMKLMKVGLLLAPDMGYLGGSIDRYRVCDCCPPRVVEIKCPHTLQHSSSEDFEKVAFLKKDTCKSLQLCKQHSYYTQVQGYMRVTGTAVADFVVWSPLSMVVLPIPFDSVAWHDIQNNIQLFYSSCVAPVLLAITEVPSRREQCLTNMVTEVECVKQKLCSSCKVMLPDAEQCKEDNSDASVQCECLCGCGKWFHWACCNFKFTNPTDTWICSQCSTSCVVL